MLREGTGFCFAKSHLLVALLRANGIRAGLAYQRLALDDERHAFCLHGLVAVDLPGYGWYRVDPRGNKPGVNAQFTPPRERLAFPLSQTGEVIFPKVYPEPVGLVVRALELHRQRVGAGGLPAGRRHPVRAGALTPGLSGQQSRPQGVSKTEGCLRSSG